MERLRTTPLMRHGIDERAGLRIAAMANLNQRLRYSYRGYEEVPEPDDGLLVEHHVRFVMAHKAGAFARAPVDLAHYTSVVLGGAVAARILRHRSDDGHIWPCAADMQDQAAAALEHALS